MYEYVSAFLLEASHPLPLSLTSLLVEYKDIYYYYYFIFAWMC